MMDRVRDRGGHAGNADFADAARAELIEGVVGVIEQDHVDIVRLVGVDRYQILGIVVVHRHGIAPVELGGLEQRHTDTHGDRAFHLVGGRFRVDDLAHVDGADHARHTQPRNAGIPANLDKVRAKGTERVFTLWRAGCVCFAIGIGEFLLIQDIGIGDRLAFAVRKLALVKAQILGLGARECRAVACGVGLERVDRSARRLGNTGRVVAVAQEPPDTGPLG